MSPTFINLTFLELYSALPILPRLIKSRVVLLAFSSGTCMRSSTLVTGKPYPNPKDYCFCSPQSSSVIKSKMVGTEIYVTLFAIREF